MFSIIEILLLISGLSLMEEYLGYITAEQRANSPICLLRCSTMVTTSVILMSICQMLFLFCVAKRNGNAFLSFLFKLEAISHCICKIGENLEVVALTNYC